MEYFFAPFRALGYIRSHHSLQKFVLVPFGITVVVVALSFRFLLQWLQDVLADFVSGDGVLMSVLSALVTVILVVLFFYAFVLFLNLIAAPFNEVLSEKVEELEHPKSARQNLQSFVMVLKQYRRTIVAEVTRMVVFTIVSIGVFVGSLIMPPFAFVGALLGVFFLVFEFIDYTASRRAWTFRQKMKFIIRHWRPCVLYGLGLALFLSVPLLNLLFIPASVVSGTQLFLQLEPQA